MLRLLTWLSRTLSRDPDAELRGARLLVENLSTAQRQQYARQRSFEVIGGQTGKRYRIRRSSAINVEELDSEGRSVGGWCFLPKGGLVIGDVMLAQKLALELFEHEALAVGYRYPRDHATTGTIHQHA